MSKPAPKKRGRGRPKFELSEAHRTDVPRLAGIGLTNDQLAAYLEVSTTCFDELMKREPEFKRAISKKRASAIGQVASTLFQQAIKPNNLTATIFYLKTQGRWAEAREQANSDDVADNEFKLAYKIE